MNETNQGLPNSDISYQVMPDPSRASGGQSTSLPPPQMHNDGGGGSAVYVITAIVVLLLLGGLAYYFLGFKKNEQNQQQAPTNSKLSVSFLQQYFAKEVCDDPNTCGDTADPDHDGLSNYEEFVAGVKPTDADTDTDGIADGDEVNVYGTNPKEKYTDTRAIAKQNDFNDGASIKNGYDPLTPGVKFTDTKISVIQVKITQYQLHAPTTLTLGLDSNGNKTQ